MNDAATRFYQRSLTIKPEAPDAVAPVQVEGHRYFAAAEALKATKPASVLEMGYGGAALIRAMAPLIGGEYHVIDIVNRVSSDLPGNVHVYQGNLDNKFPFSDDQFDVVIAMMVIEHMYDPFHAFQEIARVLRKQGRVYLNLPNVASIRCRWDLLLGRMPMTSASDWFEKREWDGNHLHYFTVKDVKRLGELFNFELVGVHPVGKKLWMKRLRPSLFCHEITFEFSLK